MIGHSRTGLYRQFAGAITRRALGLLSVRRGPAILMFHRVAQESFDPWGLAVSPDNFANQLEWIARNRIALRLTEFVERNRAGKLPHDAIALTFDDGYACNATSAFPLLERLEIPATVFLPVELIHRQAEFWWDELEQIVLDQESRSLRLDEHSIELGETHPADKEWLFEHAPRTPRQQAYFRLWSLLRRRSPAGLEAGMQQLREQTLAPARPRESHRPLNPDEIRSIQSEFVEFGSHSLTHPSLPHLHPEEKEHQIKQSRIRCAKLVGVDPQSFAYPFGAYDAESAQLVEDTGFLCACTVTPGFVAGRANPFALPRIFVGDWDSPWLARRLGQA